MTGAGRNKGRGRGAKKAPDITSYDGPVEETRGTPSASSGRGRAPSNAPTGPRDSSRSRGVMSPTRSNPGSREASLVQAQKNEPNTNVVLSRNVEFGGNAYNIFDPVSFNSFSKHLRAAAVFNSHRSAIPSAFGVCCSRSA